MSPLPRPVRLGIAIAAAIGLSLAVAAALLPRWLDAEALRPEIESVLSDLLAREVTLGDLTVSIWGPSAKAGRLRVAEPERGRPGAAPTLDAGRVRVGLELVPLLRGQVRLRWVEAASGTVRLGERVLLDDVSLRTRIGGGGDGGLRSAGWVRAVVPGLPGAPRGGLSFDASIVEDRLVVEECTIEVGRTVIRGTGEATGVRSGSPRLALEGTGTVGGVRAEGSLVAVLRRGEPDLQFDFDACGGSHEGRLRMNALDADLPFMLGGRVEGARVEEVLGALNPGRAAALSGTGFVVVDATGTAPGGRVDRGTIRGTAKIEIRDGRLRGVGLLRQVIRRLEMGPGRDVGAEDTPFRSLSGTFRAVDGVAETSDLALRSADFDLDGGGTVALDGEIDLRVVAAFSRDVSRAMVSQVPKLRWRMGADERLTFPLEVRGSLGSPRVQIDLERVLEEGIEQMIRDKKQKLLRKLGGGR